MLRCNRWVESRVSILWLPWENTGLSYFFSHFLSKRLGKKNKSEQRDSGHKLKSHDTNKKSLRKEQYLMQYLKKRKPEEMLMLREWHCRYIQESNDCKLRFISGGIHQLFCVKETIWFRGRYVKVMHFWRCRKVPKNEMQDSPYVCRLPALLHDEFSSRRLILAQTNQINNWEKQLTFAKAFLFIKKLIASIKNPENSIRHL